MPIGIPYFGDVGTALLNERIVVVFRARPVTKAQLQRVLIVGLCVSALLLLSAVVVAFRTAMHIQEDTGAFAARQAAAKGAIDLIETQQADLNNRWLQLARKRDVISREEVLEQIADSRKEMSSALESAYAQTELLRESIYQHAHGLLQWTVWLFTICVGLSLICASWAVRVSAGLFGQLERQAAELSQMQYQFLETQEQTARRFSHELHDELGQELTAIKANLAAARVECTPERVDDCMRLVDTAIQSVREMSQLLRPTILDDFGLDAALRSLTDGFAQRTGIQVSYTSDMDGRRLPDTTETSLFRIAQEALTNVARHSGATAVKVDLRSDKQDVVLRISDNGQGFDVAERRPGAGLGLAGMQTRARGCGGAVQFQSGKGKGLRIEVTCPAGFPSAHE